MMEIYFLSKQDEDAADNASASSNEGKTPRPHPTAAPDNMGLCFEFRKSTDPTPKSNIQCSAKLLSSDTL
jgi:hypothetical protein